MGETGADSRTSAGVGETGADSGTSAGVGETGAEVEQVLGWVTLVSGWVKLVKLVSG